MSDTTDFFDRKRTIIVLPWESICGNCGKRALLKEDRHMTIPAAQTNDGVQPGCEEPLPNAATTLLGKKFENDLRKVCQGRTWVGIVSEE